MDKPWYNKRYKSILVGGFLMLNKGSVHVLQAANFENILKKITKHQIWSFEPRQLAAWVMTLRGKRVMAKCHVQE